jgi:hypothetical protein
VSYIDFADKAQRPGRASGCCEHARPPKVRGGKVVVTTGDIKFGSTVGTGTLKIGGTTVRRPVAIVDGEAVFAPEGQSAEVTQELAAMRAKVLAAMPRPAASSPAPPPPPDPVRSRPGYRVVSLTEVPTETYRAAKAALATATAELGWGYAGIEWYTDAAPEHGFARPDRPSTVYVRADLAPEEAAWTVRHELMHLKQFKRGVVDRAAAEAEADDFADREGWK